MFRLIEVHDHQRGLWFRRGQFQDLILPGSTWLLSWQDRIDIVDLRQELRFDHPLLESLLEAPQVSRELLVVRIEQGQCAVLWKDGEPLESLKPGVHAYWKTEATLQVQRLDCACTPGSGAGQRIQLV